jgi:hypothetical protein
MGVHIMVSGPSASSAASMRKSIAQFPAPNNRDFVQTVLNLKQESALPYDCMLPMIYGSHSQVGPVNN